MSADTPAKAAHAASHESEAPAELLDGALRRMTAAGAEAGDAVLIRDTGLALTRRLGAVETVDRSESQHITLRAFVGRRQAVVAGTDLSPAGLQDLAERVVAMARVVPEDPQAGLATPDQLATTWPDLDLADTAEVSTADLAERAAAAEETARVTEGVTNSNGASAGWSHVTVALAGTNGFFGSFTATRHSCGVSVVAGTGTGMESGSDNHSARHLRDLASAEALGRRAGQLAVGRLGPRKVSSGRVPMIFDPFIAAGLADAIADALNGRAIARRTSFLLDSLGTAVAGPEFRLIDEPLRPRGLASKPFDDEGLPVATTPLIDGGVVQTWLMDLKAARQLGYHSTGHAERGGGGQPSPQPTNLTLAAGRRSREDLIGSVKSGLYVDRMMGRGVNLVTGDYSRGAAGYWIQDGALTHPVSEVTVAGNLAEMLREASPADDLVYRYPTNAPTVRIDGMTVAGN